MSSLMPTSRALRWTFAIVAILVSGIVGYFLGSRDQQSGAGSTGTSSQIEALQQQHSQELAQMRAQRDLASSTSANLQLALKDLQAESLKHESTARLYNRIEGLDASSGLSVDTIVKTLSDDGVANQLHVTLIQARGRNRVSGEVGVTLVGEKDGTAWRETLAEVGTKTALSFDLRFFETLTVVLPDALSSKDTHVDYVEIQVKPSGRPHKPFKTEKEWAGIVAN